MKQIPDKNILLFKSCLVSVEYPGVQSSTTFVFDKIGIDYFVSSAQTCCTGLGHYSDVFDQFTTTVNGARHFALSHKLNRPNFAMMCATCYAINKRVADLLNGNKDLRDSVNEVFEESGYDWMRYSEGDIKSRENIFHIIDIFYSKRKEIAENIKYDFSDFKIATHHGCHYCKAHYNDTIEGVRNPHILDDVVNACGVETIGWYDFKRATCGNGFSQRFVHKDLSMDSTFDKFKSLKDKKTEILIHLCPNCHIQFDRYQPYIEREYGEKLDIVNLNIAQFLAIAMGADPYDVVGIQTHTVPVEPIFDRLKPISDEAKEEIIKNVSRKVDLDNSADFNMEADTVKVDFKEEAE